MSSSDTSTRENTRITLGLLEAVEAGRARTQRGLAADLGIALGLVNIYLKRCIKKGLVKVSQAPAHRYGYYLTPQGFAEKSRLTGEFLSLSLTFFRRAKSSCGDVFAQAKAMGWQRVGLAGNGDLADIARICATDAGIEIVCIIDPGAASAPQSRIPLLPDFEGITNAIDGIVITDVKNGARTFTAAVAALGQHRILTPSVVSTISYRAEEVIE